MSELKRSRMTLLLYSNPGKQVRRIWDFASSHFSRLFIRFLRSSLRISSSCFAATVLIIIHNFQGRIWRGNMSKSFTFLKSYIFFEWPTLFIVGKKHTESARKRYWWSYTHTFIAHGFFNNLDKNFLSLFQGWNLRSVSLRFSFWFE